MAIVDLVRAGLSAPSVILPTKIACLEPARILRVAGTLSEAETSAARSRVRGFLQG
jgi:mRNA interferase MazF